MHEAYALSFTVPEHEVFGIAMTATAMNTPWATSPACGNAGSSRCGAPGGHSRYSLSGMVLGRSPHGSADDEERGADNERSKQHRASVVE